MQANYFIAVCDILGFSALVRENDLDSVVVNSLGFFRKALSHSLHKSGFPIAPPPTAELTTHSYVGVAWFSDTILLYTKEDSDEAVRALLSTVAWLLFETLLHGQTKVRAGIAYGQAFIDPVNSLFVGQPIIEAHEMEQDQEWSGAALTPSAYERIPELARTGIYADWWLIPHDVPLKQHRKVRTLAVNWNMGFHNPEWRLLWSKNADSPSHDDWKSNQSICEKFTNTRDFHELHCHICSNRRHVDHQRDED